MSQYDIGEAKKAIGHALRYNQQLFVPHIRVKDINDLEPTALKESGIEYVLFDRDNTLARPYTTTAHPRIAKKLEEFKSIYGSNLGILSNHAGMPEDIGDMTQQTELNLGIGVIRHAVKKPGFIDEVAQLPYEPSQIAMIGDRVTQDILYGNRQEYLTVLTGIFTLRGENWGAMGVRPLERAGLRFLELGLRAPPHEAHEKYVRLTA